jgi:hypothetical protein
MTLQDHQVLIVVVIPIILTLLGYYLDLYVSADQGLINTYFHNTGIDWVLVNVGAAIGCGLGIGIDLIFCRINWKV